MAGTPPSLPPGRLVTLPDRGDTWIWDAPGPSGAPTLVLLHGWMSTAALNWYAAFEELSSRFRVIAPDHRGHGRGLQGDGAFSLEDCADDLAALIDALDLPPVIAVGYSMGGPIACLLWRRHPELVDGLVLCATGARFAGRPELSGVVQVVGRGIAWAVGWVPPRVVRQGAARLAHLRGQQNAATPESWVTIESEGGSPAAFIQAATALNGLDARDWMPEIDVPTAVVVTTEDRTVAPERQRWLAEAIPGAGTYEVCGDHRACVDAADEFIPTLLQACTDISRRAAERRAAAKAAASADAGGAEAVSPVKPRRIPRSRSGPAGSPAAAI